MSNITIYVCYHDRGKEKGELEQCSPPIVFFTNAESAVKWSERTGGVYRAMTPNEPYLPR